MTWDGVASGAMAAVLMCLAALGLRYGLDGRRRTAVRRRLEAAGGPSRAPNQGATGDAASGRQFGWCAPLLRTPPQLASRLHDVGLEVAPTSVWMVWVATGAFLPAVSLLAGGPGAGAVAISMVALAPIVGWRLLRHRGAARLEAALPSVVESVAAGLRSGASLRQALAESARTTTGPLGEDLTMVATAIERGSGVVTALEAWAVRRPLAGVRLVVAALCLGAETGGATARAVDAVAATLRQRLAAYAEARALATQARVSAVVIAAAPLAFACLSAATDSRSAHFLLQTPTGLMLLSAGLCLDAVGALWMARLTRAEP